MTEFSNNNELIIDHNSNITVTLSNKSRFLLAYGFKVKYFLGITTGYMSLSMPVKNTIQFKN